MARRMWMVGRRGFLRGAVAWIATSIPAVGALRAQDDAGRAAAVSIPFETTPGATFDLVASVVSTFQRATPGSRPAHNRGGMFRQAYVATVVERDADGVATVRIDGRRGNGAYWGAGGGLVLYDSEDPKGTHVVRDKDDDPRYIVHASRWGRAVKLSRRSEFVAVRDERGKPAVFVAPRLDAQGAGDLQCLFLRLPDAAMRPGDSCRSRIFIDRDPNRAAVFANETPVDLAMRLEGVVDGVARFSVRGGVEPDAAGEAYFRAANRVVEWIDRIDVEGVVDVDVATGWVRARDQTMRIAYRWIGRVRDGAKTEVVRMLNTRRLIVSGSRTA